ncbi:two-component regulator propeller domain-containing protein [Chitinophaga cymbidii]|uniref:two-component regulator propeller domain-containing protein n=1 Tax=Chitinophaga cymbidii TaxID=1096750 RepID=UPI001FE24AD8|nr:two-component regulator propeller domain-containing protein [Chitinophaga cymbidii]
MIRKCFQIPLLLCILLNAYAQRPSYRFTSLNINNGLSNNQVNCIYKDAAGFMWFGTMSGLNRYDGYTFRVFRHNMADTFSINEDYISGIFPVPGNKMYVKTRNGDNIYDPSTEKFSEAPDWLKSKGLPDIAVICIHRAGNSFWLAAESGLYKIDSSGKAFKLLARTAGQPVIADIKTDSKGNAVILYNNGHIEMRDARSHQVIYRDTAVAAMLGKQRMALMLFIDAQDDIWTYAPGNDFGVVYLNPREKNIRQLSSKNGILNNDIVYSIIQDEQGLIWVGTDHGGINVIDKQGFRSSFMLNKEDDEKSIAENAIYSLYKDDLGIIWCGTYKRGISYFAESMGKFSLYTDKSSGGSGLGYKDVNCFAEDKNGNIWIGTNGGGLIYFDRAAGRFSRYRHNPSDDNSISNDVIVSLYMDRRDNLWIGYYFGGMDHYANGKFTHFRHKHTDPNSLAGKSVWRMYEDQRNNFWVGTLGGGLDRFDRSNGIFYHNNADLPNSVHSNFITSFAEDKNGDLWIGTSYGIDVLDKAKGIFLHYLSATHQLSNDNVNILLCDRNNNMWAGTRAGLNVFDPTTRTFKSFRVEDGLPDNNIISMLEDNEGHIWVSTSNGLGKITVLQDADGIGIRCRSYDDADGLQGRAFNVNAALKLRSGELVFGGTEGFNIFDPSTIPQNHHKPSIVFTDLQIFNRKVAVHEELHHRVILPQSLSTIKEIVLRHNENDFSIDFAALNYVNTDKNRYAYMLEGFNKEWSTIDGKTRRLTYTNINPGDYTLHVKAANEDGIWNDEGISLNIRILPPFWKTPLAYATYVLLAALILFLARKAVIRRARRRFALEHERAEAHRLHELDMMKIRLFTNVSHELRTPVSLILTSANELIRNGKPADEKHKFQLIHRNARRLLNLVNQLMDFRKMEMRELKSTPTPGDVAGFVKEVVQSFTDLAERKSISFSYHTTREHLYTMFDHGKMERILFNLLSNAFKFTPEGGSVDVSVDISEQEDQTWLEIRVKDSGIGIPEERQAKIFERFFQNEVPGALVSQGSGIGLAITREFVKLANGTISVTSEVDKGSCFTLRLPCELLEGIVPRKDNPPGQKADPPSRPADTKGKKKQTVLLVEDNEDFLFYLKDNLKAFYNIIEATDGGAGWQKTLSAHPDLVVSDVNMPVMDGMELCRKIKGDPRTRQIPVILLTAMVEEEEQLKGLEMGAVDYMIKPVNFEIMLSRLRNILAQQTAVKHVIVSSLKTDNEAPAPSPDETFMRKVLQIVEENMSNAEFSVTELSRALCMNRVSVYKRIFSLTGQPPTELIRSLRLRRAAELLSTTEMNITEVAYEVGFNNPKYFARYFKIAFDMLPSAYVAEQRRKLSS